MLWPLYIGVAKSLEKQWVNDFFVISMKELLWKPSRFPLVFTSVFSAGPKVRHFHGYPVPHGVRKRILKFPLQQKQMGVSKNRGIYPKTDGENNGKPYFLMDDLGVPLFLETPK